eukprot:Gb_06421 [translate_table: standard]
MVIKAVISMLQTALPMCGDGPCHRVFKAFYPGDKAEQKRTIEYVEKVANSMKCGFLIAARDIFTAKVSGTFNRPNPQKSDNMLHNDWQDCDYPCGLLADSHR